jgi:hypothetical protein
MGISGGRKKGVVRNSGRRQAASGRDLNEMNSHLQRKMNMNGVL